jgi:hypothetical protein
MKTNFLRKKNSLVALFLAAIFITGCKKDDDSVPAEENELEVITDVKLIFTNTEDANDVVEARAQDPDGEGVEELKILDEIELEANTSYTLTFEIMNNLESPGEDIRAEILEEDDEHQFFFHFSEGLFTNPEGDGNFDNAADPIRYNDNDGNGNPLGLSTTWTTADTHVHDAHFAVKLQHQPGVKTASSGANDGDTDFELEFDLHIE